MTVITIHPPIPHGEQPYQILEEDHEHFINTFNRALALSHGEGVLDVRIMMDLRRPLDALTDPGWLEHTIVVGYHRSARVLMVGAIQRKPGEKSEFHS